MTESVILNNTYICIITAAALLAMFAATVLSNKTVSAVLNVFAFLCVAGCVTYALLLGAELNELLVYILIFTLLGMTAFIPKKTAGDGMQEKITDTVTKEEDILPEPNVSGNETDDVHTEPAKGETDSEL